MKTLIEGLNRKIRDFSVFFVKIFILRNFCLSFFFFFEKRKEKNMYSEKGERESVIWPLQLEDKWRVLVSFQAISSITSTRIINKGVLNYSLHQGVEDNLGAHMPFIQESENRQEDCGLELIKAVKFEECRICTIRGNSKPLSLKLSRIDICYVMILIVCVCCDYTNFLYD